MLARLDTGEESPQCLALRPPLRRFFRLARRFVGLVQLRETDLSCGENVSAYCFMPLST